MYSKITLIGHLARDPQMVYMTNGSAKTNFSIAVNRRWLNKATNTTEEEVAWYQITVWGARAEAANQYLRKGSKVFVEGRLRPGDDGNPRLWQRQDGTLSASYDVTAANVLFLDGSDKETAPQNGEEMAAPF